MTLLQDLRYSLRMLRKSPLITAVAIITLALGIGANTAMYSLLRQLFVSNFQYKDLDTLVIVQSKNLSATTGAPTGMSTPDLMDFRDQNKVFDGMGTFRFSQYIFDSGAAVIPLRAVAVTPNLFPILGVQPIAGRYFHEDEGQAGNDMVTVLSEGFWTRQYARDPGLIGKTIRLNGRTHAVVGVMPAGFFREGELFTPMVIGPEERNASERSERGLRVWARLKPGVSVKQAASELSLIAGRLAEQFKQTNEGWGIHLLRPSEVVAQQRNIAGIIYYLPVGFVLLIACANVAHLQLARALEREKEVALRTALGAGRFQIMRQLLTESVLIAVLGGVLGLVVAYYGVRSLQNYLPDLVTRSIGGLRLDREALQFMLLVALFSGVLFGFAPAWKASRVDLNHSLKEGSTKTSTGRGGKRLRNLMLISEIALTTMLLGGAGLALSLVGGGGYSDMGFNHKKVLSASLFLQSARFAKPEARLAFAEEALGRLKSLPGVRSATYANGMPMSSPGSNRQLSRVGDKDAAASARKPNISYQIIEPGYFRTLEVPIKAGRAFGETDREGSAPVAIVNEELVRQYFPNSNPLGERIILNPPPRLPGAGPAPPTPSKPVAPREIVGVVKDVKQIPVDVLPQPAIAYIPFPQDPQQFVSFAVRAENSAAALTLPVSEKIQSIAPELLLGSIGPMEQQINDAVRLIRFLPMVLTSLAVLGLILAGVGTYGTTAYSMAQRTQEFGIRMALGARPGDVLRMVLTQGLKLTALGFAIGAAGTYALVKIMLSLLPPTGAQGPELITRTEIALTCGLAMLALGAVGLLANYAPARRATQIDPVSAMRND